MPLGSVIPQNRPLPIPPGGGRGSYGPVAANKPLQIGSGSTNAAEAAAGGALGGSYGKPWTPQSGSVWQAAAAPSSPASGGYGMAQSLYETYYGPQQAALQASSQNAALMGQLQSEAAGMDVGYLQSQYDNQMGQLGLQQQGNAADMATAQRQIDMAYQLGQIDDQEYRAQKAYLEQQKGSAYAQNKTQLDYLASIGAISNQDYQRTLAYLQQQEGFAGQQQGLTNQGLTNTLTGSLADIGRARRAEASDATARGALGSMGHGEEVSYFQQQDVLAQDRFNIGKGQSGLTFAETMAGIGNQRGEAGSQYGREQAGITKGTSEANQGLADALASIGWQSSQADFGYGRGNISREESIARQKDQIAALQLQAQSFGLDAQAYQSALDRGIANIGMQGAMSAADVAGMIASNDAQLAALGQQIAQMAIENAPRATSSSKRPTGRPTRSHLPPKSSSGSKYEAKAV